MIYKNPGLFKFWANFQVLSNSPSFPSKLPSFPLFPYWTNSVFTVLSYALASHSRTPDIHCSPHNMSFFGLGSKNKVLTIPPPSPFPIPKKLTYCAAQVLATRKTSWENDYVQFGTYKEGARMFDSKLFIAHSNISQFLYNRHPFDRDLRGIDFTNDFINIDINKQTQHTYLSPAHNLFFHKDEYMPKVAFYLAPPMDKTGLPPMVKASKHYVEFLKNRFASPSTPTCGWFITTSYDREVTSKSYLPTMNGSLVQIQHFIAEIHVFKETKTNLLW